MALQTFRPPIAPSPGTIITPKLNILRNDFGDGYTQATPNGINFRRRELSLSWDYLLPPQAEAIMAFLDSMGGVVPFYYTPSDAPAPIKWTCDTYDDKRIMNGRTVTAKFVESFLLAS